MNADPNALSIYTDGSSFSHPRRGGGGFVFVFPDCLNREPLFYCPPGYQKSTNNQMELMACIIALAESMRIPRQWQRIIIYTDSSYVFDGYKKARFQWSRNKWLKSNGAPVAHMDLWKELLKNVQKTGALVDIQWVKGHDKNEFNETADKLAKQSSRGF